MRQLGLFVAVMFLGRASGDLISVSANLPADVPADSTQNFEILLSNNTDTDAMADLFAGYQIVLELVPNGLTTGTLSFLSATIADPYVFPTNFGITTILLGSSQLARVSDSKLPITAAGEQVPMAAMSLFTIPVSVSDDASGMWTLRTVNDVGKTSEWTDSSRDQALARDFVSLSSPGTQSLGSFNVTPVPEPSQAVCFVIFGIVLAAKFSLKWHWACAACAPGYCMSPLRGWKMRNFASR